MTQARASLLLSDAVIARRAARGSKRALAAIYERYHQDLYRYCAAILGNSEDAHDAVQNTMLKVLHALPGEKREVKLKPWLYRIAHNEAIDMIRARTQTEPVKAETLIGHTGPADEVQARERLQSLVADIGGLPDRQRGALVMREMGGLSYEQIGAALRTSPAVARQTIYEARLGLRQMSEGREMPCQEVMRAISDEDGRVLRRRDIHAHLNHCEGCQAFRTEISGRRHELALIAPLPAAISAGILQGLLGGGAAAGSGAATGGAGAGAGAVAGKALIGTAAIKSAAAVGIVAAVGVFAADKGGLVHIGAGDRGPAATQSTTPQAAGGDPNAAKSETESDSKSLSGNGKDGNGSGQSQRLGTQRETSKAGVNEAALSGPGSAQGLPTNSPPAQVPGSNGRHLGSTGAASHPAHPAKPNHPDKAKGNNGASAAPPGQGAKNPGKGKQAASAKPTQKKPPEPAASHPAHPEHPPHPQQPPAPPAEPSPPPTTEAESVKPESVTGE